MRRLRSGTFWAASSWCRETRCVESDVTCNVLVWLVNVQLPQVRSGCALIASGFAHRACAPFSSGCPTSDHPSSRSKPMINRSPLRPATSSPMIKRSSTHSATTSETRRDLDRCRRQRVRRQTATGRHHPRRSLRRNRFGHGLCVHHRRHRCSTVSHTCRRRRGRPASANRAGSWSTRSPPSLAAKLGERIGRLLRRRHGQTRTIGRRVPRPRNILTSGVRPARSGAVPARQTCRTARSRGVEHCVISGALGRSLRIDGDGPLW